MTIRTLFIVFASLLVIGCASRKFSTPNASGRYTGRPLQCVPYARGVSGIQIFGDAHTWWDQAYPAYSRGGMPRLGAVLVLSQTPRMSHGHLAVVKHIINNRQIDVTHSNWGNNRKNRSIIYDLVRVEDVSVENNWSLVRFWNHEAGSFGFPYAAKGFIYK